MISAVFLVATQAPKDRILEVPGDPTRTVIEVVVPLPALDPYQRRIGQITAASITQGSAGFTRGATMDATLVDGITASIVGDTLRFGIESESPNPRMAILILADAILRPLFDQEVIDSASASLTTDRGLLSDVYGEDLDLTPATRARVIDFWRRYVSPSTMSVAIMGGFASGTPTRYWREALSEYRKPDLRYEPVSSSKGKHVKDWSVWEGKASPWGNQGPARLLAAFALGAGKGSTVFRSLRRDSGLSYRQEFFWQPTKAGWKPLIVLKSSATPEAKRDALAKLREDVSKWTESDRKRAIAMAQSAYRGSSPWDPITTELIEGGRSLESISAWRYAAWPVISGTAWNPEGLLSQLEGTDLEQMTTAGLADLPSEGGN